MLYRCLSSVALLAVVLVTSAGCTRTTLDPTSPDPRVVGADQGPQFISPVSEVEPLVGSADPEMVMIQRMDRFDPVEFLDLPMAVVSHNPISLSVVDLRQPPDGTHWDAEICASLWENQIKLDAWKRYGKIVCQQTVLEDPDNKRYWLALVWSDSRQSWRLRLVPIPDISLVAAE